MNIIELSNDFCITYFSVFRRVANALGLTQAQALCICSIPFEGLSQSELSKKLSIDLSTLSRNLDRLIDKNIIKKKISGIDKRSYRINLTAKGNGLQKKINSVIFIQLKECFQSISIEESNQFEEILNKLNWQLELLNQ
tara:strand:+ start:862 stop:1278 length:417 start_codon:yes stop_codon:yes gene_type:complete